jgi:hypothetical protein
MIIAILLLPLGHISFINKHGASKIIDTFKTYQQVGATRRAGIFLGDSRAFVSFGLPERASGEWGWPGLAGWMKAQIRAKTRNRGRDWAFFAVRMKKGLPGASSGSWLEMLLGRGGERGAKDGFFSALASGLWRVQNRMTVGTGAQTARQLVRTDSSRPAQRPINAEVNAQ